jgi:hypothetical protein
VNRVGRAPRSAVRFVGMLMLRAMRGLLAPRSRYPVDPVVRSFLIRSLAE